MRLQYFTLLIFLLAFGGVVISFPAIAQESEQDLKIEGLNVSDIVKVETASTYLKECLGNYRRHFTPRSHHNFCNCSAANIRVHMTESSFSKIKRDKYYTPGDKEYEKYIEKVIIPCMVIAVPDITHVACLERRGHSPYITNIIPYCQCVSDRITGQVKKHGTASILKNMSVNPKVYHDPADTLLNTGPYKTATYDAYRSCRSIGVKQPGTLQ